MTTTPAAAAWHEERGRLVGIAYRMLGDFGDAEDVVSEVAVEALRAESAGEVRSWPGWLTTTCVRRSIDRLRQLAASREDYPGPWLPEPIATARLPEDVVAGREMLSITVLHLAEQLTPEARVAVVLHRAFGMTAGEIGQILDRTAASVRQLISRGERRLQIQDLADAPGPGAVREVLSNIVNAIESGDVESVVEFLAEDAILWSDGGGLVKSALNPLFGADRIMRFFLGILETAITEGAELGVSIVEVNGELALSLRIGDAVDVVTFEFAPDAAILGIRRVSNPAKLTRALG